MKARRGEKGMRGMEWYGKKTVRPVGRMGVQAIKKLISQIWKQGEGERCSQET